MTVNDLFMVLRSRVVYPQIDIDGSLQDGLEKVLNDNLIEPVDLSRKVDFIYFDRSNDKRVTKIMVNLSYLGETLLEVITHIENEFPVRLAATPNPEGGFNLQLEYKKELETYVGKPDVFHARRGTSVNRKRNRRGSP